jgi:hypothetical protein
LAEYSTQPVSSVAPLTMTLPLVTAWKVMGSDVSRGDDTMVIDSR